MTESTNINEIIRISLKSLTDTVKNQGLAIRDLSKKLSNKPSREEIDNYLKFKPNDDEILTAINNLSQELNNRPTHEEIVNALDQKINKDELMFYLNQKNNSEELNMNQYEDLINKLETLKNDIFTKINQLENDCVNKDDFAIIKNELDNKANILDIENALEAKEDKNNINFLMKNMVDKNEINNMINNSMNKNKNFNFNKNEFDQFLLEYQNDFKNLENKIMNKCYTKIMFHSSMIF